MKILLSAYACEPGKGSEPGVGWNWARALRLQGHDVHVLTRSNNAPAVDRAIAAQGLRITTTYFDLPAWCRRWKHWGAVGMYFYYLFWQMGGYRRAKSLHRLQPFDRVHHVTFASFRQPSFMGWLGIPFILGPVGGGETMPRKLRRGLPLRSRVREVLRDFGNTLVKCDPMMHTTFSHALLIACTTAETRARIPTRFLSKCIVQPTIGVEVAENKSSGDAPPPSSSTQAAAPPRFLFIGRLLYWKGIHLALGALPEVRRSCPDVRFKIIGEGSELLWLKKLAEEHGVADMVDWVPWMPHDEIFNEYLNNTAFVFPSLHDSGGMVVLEALAAGLPVICLNLGGPGLLVNSGCGVVIDAKNADEPALHRSVAAAMIRLAQDRPFRNQLAANCAPRARELSWQRGAEVLYAAANQAGKPTAIVV